jgi:hypothetical protein
MSNADEITIHVEEIVAGRPIPRVAPSGVPVPEPSQIYIAPLGNLRRHALLRYILA